MGKDLCELHLLKQSAAYKKFVLVEEKISTITVTTSKGVVIPAINELRYVGNHILKASTCENYDQAEEQYTETLPKISYICFFLYK